MAVVAAFGTQADVSERQHVGVGPMTGALHRRPSGESGKLLVDVLPAVPEVVGDAPHLRDAAQEIDVGAGHPAARGQR